MRSGQPPLSSPTQIGSCLTASLPLTAEKYNNIRAYSLTITSTSVSYVHVVSQVPNSPQTLLHHTRVIGQWPTQDFYNHCGKSINPPLNPIRSTTMKFCQRRIKQHYKHSTALTHSPSHPSSIANKFLFCSLTSVMFPMALRHNQATVAMLANGPHSTFKIAATASK